MQTYKKHGKSNNMKGCFKLNSRSKITYSVRNSQGYLYSDLWYKIPVKNPILRIFKKYRWVEVSEAFDAVSSLNGDNMYMDITKKLKQNRFWRKQLKRYRKNKQNHLLNRRKK